MVLTAPANEANMAWLKALDLSLNWVYKIKDRVEVQPGVSFFNLMNFANFDGPTSPLSGSLSTCFFPLAANTCSPTLGTVNGTAGQQPNSNRLGLGSGVFALGSPRVIEFSLKASF